MRKRFIYVILETVYDEDGYIPCFVREGESGYSRSYYNYGKDLNEARKLAQERNESMGIDAKTAEQIHDENLRLSFARAKTKPQT